MKDLINKIYIGSNGSGKSREIEICRKEIQPKNEQNVIFIPTEQLFKDEVEKEKTTGKGNFIYQIKLLIQEVFGKISCFDYEISQKTLDEIAGRAKFKKEINDFFTNISVNDNDYILTPKNLLEDKLNFNTLNINLSCYDTPSGKNNYSLIKLLSEILIKAKNNKIKLNGMEKYYLLIDEPEKFCHPQLIKKLATYLKIIAKNINVILTTHSPLFLSYYIDEEKTNVILLDSNSKNDGFRIIDVVENLKRLGIQKTETSIKIMNNKIHRIPLFENLFSNKILLVEDISTKFFIEYILEDANNFDYNVFVCHGVNYIWHFNEILSEMGIIKENINYIVDLDGEIKGKTQLEYDKLEEDNFIYKFKDNLESDINVNAGQSILGVNGKSNASAIINNIDEIKKTGLYKDISNKFLM